MKLLKKVLVWLLSSSLLISGSAPCFAQKRSSSSSRGRDVRVKSYVRKDGTYVPSHTRSAPDRSFDNNWTTKGNYNPYTLKDGTKISQPIAPGSKYTPSGSAYPMAAPRRSTLESPSPTVSSVSPNYSTYQVGSSVNDSQKLETETESATTKILKKRLQNYANILWDRAKKGIISEEVAEEIWQLRWAQEVLVLENETLLLENEKLRSQLVQLQKKEYQPDTVSTKINKDAERTSNPAPELTAEMKKRSFNANLRIRVTVNPDGSHEEELIQGSGDSEIDALVLKTMRRWKWQPALRDGEKVTNSQVFRYTISIND